MKSKVIAIKFNKEAAFIKILAAQFGVYSDGELKLIEVLARLDMFLPFHMDKYTRARLLKEMNVPYTTLGTCLRRLTKAGIIGRNSKSFYVNVAFRGLGELDCLVFKATEKTPSND